MVVSALNVICPMANVVSGDVSTIVIGRERSRECGTNGHADGPTGV